MKNRYGIEKNRSLKKLKTKKCRSKTFCVKIQLI